MNTTRRRHREAQVRQWFAMWLTKQDTGMETLFAADAHYIESWGPEYHGRTNIQRWFAEWNTRGTVVQWDIGTFFHREPGRRILALLRRHGGRHHPVLRRALPSPLERPGGDLLPPGVRVQPAPL